ncbi:MAG: hypothetical protein HFH88_01065 [Lachnospiraceae bacterium]|nr:hypothetical protein [Lachnospiraceae bacterium]
MKKIIGLVGGASGRELTEQIQKAGFEVALICGKENEPGNEIAEHVLVTDLNNSEEVYNFLQELKVEYLMLGTGHRFAFSLGEILEQKGIKLNVNIKASKIAKEKSFFKDFISDKGFLTPAYVSIPDLESMPSSDTIIETVGLPCVVKATVDTMLPQKAANKDSLVNAVNEILGTGSPAIAEQFIRGIDLTVFVSAAKGEAKALPICYYSKAEDNDMKGFGSSEYLKEHLTSEVETKVMAYCERLVIACGFEGLPRVDLMVLPDGTSYVLETNSVGVTGINERHAAYCKGTVLALREQGIDVAEIAVKTALMKFGLL